MTTPSVYDQAIAAKFEQFIKERYLNHFPVTEGDRRAFHDLCVQIDQKHEAYRLEVVAQFELFRHEFSQGCDALEETIRSRPPSERVE